MMLALSGLGTASASASEFPCAKKAGTKNYVLCVAGKKIGTPSKQEKAIYMPQLKAGTVVSAVFDPGSKVEVTCETDKAQEGEILSGGGKTASMSKIHMNSSGCKVKEGTINRPQCGVSEFVLPTRESTTGLFGSLGNVTFENPATSFTEIDVLGGSECHARGNWEFQGHLECKIQEAEVEQIDKLLVCNPEEEAKNGDLRLPERQGGEPATIGMQEVLKLSGTMKGQKFSIVED
jgi:hypothetical protein